MNLYRQPLALSLHAQAHTQQIGRGYVLPDVLCSDFHVIEDQPSFYIFTAVLNVGKPYWIRTLFILNNAVVFCNFVNSFYHLGPSK